MFRKVFLHWGGGLRFAERSVAAVAIVAAAAELHSRHRRQATMPPGAESDWSAVQHDKILLATLSNLNLRSDELLLPGGRTDPLRVEPFSGLLQEFQHVHLG